MKLLLVINDPQVLDEESYVFKRLRAYARYVDEVHVVLRAEKTFTKKTDTIYVHAVGVPKLLMAFVLPLRIRQLIRAKRIDVVSAQDPFEIGLFAYLGTRGTRAMLSLQVHTDFLSPWFVRSFPMGVVNRVRLVLADFLLPKARAIRVVSTRIQRSLAKKYGARIVTPTVLPIAIEKNAQRKDIKKGERVIVSVSRLEEEKRVEDTLQAFARVQSKYPQWRLQILNTGRKKKKLEKLAQVLGIAGAVEFLGYKRNVNEYIDEAEIFIQTSSYEGYGMSFIEAALIGTPIIATDVGIMGELLQHGTDALVAPVGSVELLTSGLERLMSDEQLRYTLAHHAHATAESFARYFDDGYARELVDSLIVPQKKERKEKLCYILPHTSPATHMRFNVEGLEILKKELDLYVIIEKGGASEVAPAGIAHLKSVGEGSTFMRVLRTYLLVLDARSKGYARAYVHYSFIGAFLAVLVGMKVFYWNCGLPWLYERSQARDFFERLVYRMVHRVVTGSPRLTDGYAQAYDIAEEKILIVPNWVDVRMFSYGAKDKNLEKRMRLELSIPESATILLSVQRLSPRKGAHLLPRILQAQGRDTYLIIAGEGPLSQELRFEFATLGLDERVRMLGSIAHASMPDLFATSDIFLLPSEEEGMAHALLDALASGTPTVCFDVGANRDLIPSEYAEYVRAPEDVSGFIEKVSYLALHAKVRGEYGRALAREAPRYDKAPALCRFVEVVTHE